MVRKFCEEHEGSPDCFSGISMESLILAQIERWQRGLGMQVEREFYDGSFG